MNTLLGLGITLAVMFSAGVGVELHSGLKEDRKYHK